MTKDSQQVARLNCLAVTFSLVVQIAWLDCNPVLAFWPFKRHHHNDNEQQTEAQQAPTPSPVSPLDHQPVRYYPTGAQEPNIVRDQAKFAQSAQTHFSPTYPIPIAADSHLIRVALSTNTKAADIYTLAPARVINAANGTVVGYLPEQSHWQIYSEPQAIVLQMRESTPKERTIANGGVAYLDSYRSESSNFKPGVYKSSETVDGQSLPTSYLPAYTEGGMSVREGDKLKNVAYFPSAPAPMPTDVQIGKYLRLPAVGFFLVADKSSDLHKASFSYNNKFYRGCLCLVSVDKQPSFSLVNYLDLEDYLLSVVPAEMPSSWPLEALKAQAVAARSYAIANSGKHGKDGYDVKDTTEDQVYLGVKSESKNSSQAVFESKDLVATYSGKPICAYFHSTSGGATELAENVWSKQLPYLKSVIGQDQLSPHFSWNKQFSVDELENNLVPDLGKLLSILIIARTPTQRATYVLFTGSSSARILPAETIRRTLNLPSTNFNVTYCDQGYAFAGHGFGHGLGLSQWGAKALAEQGYNAEQILKYYYKDINVERLADVCHY